MRVASYVLLLFVAAVVLLLIAVIIVGLARSCAPRQKAIKAASVSKRAQLRYLAAELADAHLSGDESDAKAGVRELEELSPQLKERDFVYFRKKYTSHLGRINDQNRLVRQELGDLKHLFRRESAVAEGRREVQD